jgi:NADH:ubiquinone oxidoreductase subunit 6 (subunit J)
MEQLTSLIPPIQQQIFMALALFIAVCGVMVAVTRNLFHSALSLVGALFGMAAMFALLEAEFVAVAQVLVYVGAISTLITFAIMLTRGMMYGRTSPTNRQMLASAITAFLLFGVLLGLTFNTPWPAEAGELGSGIAVVPTLGLLFVNDYVIAFIMLALLLLVALSGALLVARDRKGVGGE